MHPHLQVAVDDDGAGFAAAPAGGPVKPPVVVDPLELRNSVTGSNHPFLARDKAKHAKTQTQRITEMPCSRDVVKSPLTTGELVFVGLLDAENNYTFEGEFAIGMGRVQSWSTGHVTVQWLSRRGWTRKFEWPKNPMFDACTIKTQQAVSQPLKVEVVLPLTIKMTPGSKHLPDKPLTDGDQRICLTKACVDELREFLRMKTPSFIRTVADPKDWRVDDDSGDSDRDSDRDSEAADDSEEEAESEAGGEEEIDSNGSVADDVDMDAPPPTPPGNPPKRRRERNFPRACQGKK